MSKRVLFRLHGKHAQEIAEDCKQFIKGYFDMFNQKVRLSIEIFDPEMEFLSIPVHPYDLFIHTASNEVEHTAHAAGWSYITGIHQAERLYKTANTTAHNNPRLVDAIKSVSIHFDTES